ncbi:MAG: rhodanese-like domain-containing protein [Xanthobacteraceae bacterium]
MATTAAQGGGMLPPTNRRRPLLRTFLSLYRSEIAFQGMVDFAVIGTAVLLFLHPPAQMRSWLGLVGIGGSGGRSGSQQQAAVVPPPSPASQSAPVPPGGPSSSAQSQVQPPAPAQPQTQASTQGQPQPKTVPSTPAKPIAFPDEISKPSLANVMLVEISENAFRTSSAADQQRLLAARTAHRSGKQAEILDILKDADGDDPNVAFMRSIGYLSRGDEESHKSGEAALRSAAERGHSLAKLLLGRVLITAPKGITKNPEEGQKLIEEVAATGDPQAERVAGIAYISAEFGSFQPDRAAAMFRKAAEAGDPQAMFHYARLLEEGIGVPADHDAAVDFLGRAAASGLTAAQYALGSWLIDLYAEKAADNPSEGAAWLEKAMDRGFSLFALNKLQNIYGWTGRAPPWNDKSKFFELAQKCSGLAERFCQNSVALAYEFGWGTGTDLVRAYIHKLMARDLGHPRVTAKEIDDLGNKLTSQERTDATERARLLRQKLKPWPALVVFQYPEITRPSPWATLQEVEKDDKSVVAQNSPQKEISDPSPDAIQFQKYIANPTGFYYWTIAFDPADFKNRPPRLEAALRTALAAYRERQAQKMLDALAGADAKDPAVNLLKGIASLTLAGDGGADMYAQAERQLRAAADAGDVKAAAILGNLLTLKRDGINRNLDQARAYAERAGRSSDGFAVRQLAIDVLIGSFGEANPTRAADLMWTAAELGDPAANAMVAAMFQNGVGVPADKDKAEAYLRRSAELGYTDSQLLLGDWIIDRYAQKRIDSPEEGVRFLENAYRDADSLYAVWRLVVLFYSEGREAPWKDRRKALEYAKKCAPYSYQSCHIALGTIYSYFKDNGRAWAHYNIARGLGWSKAAEWLDKLEKSMTKNEIGEARKLSESLRRDLKAMPTVVAILDKSAANAPARSSGIEPAASAANFADELTDWGVSPQASLKEMVGSRTPLSLPGIRRITTQELRQMISGALLIDVLNDTGPLHLTIPSAVHVPGGGNYGEGRFNDRIQNQFEKVMSSLVMRNPDKPIIFFCASALCWESYNAALRAQKMGLRNILWYRGGIRSWQEAKLPIGVPTEVHKIK